MNRILKGITSFVICTAVYYWKDISVIWHCMLCHFRRISQCFRPSATEYYKLSTCKLWGLGYFGVWNRLIVTIFQITIYVISRFSLSIKQLKPPDCSFTILCFYIFIVHLQYSSTRWTSLLEWPNHRTVRPMLTLLVES